VGAGGGVVGGDGRDDGMVGESGGGKRSTAQTILRLLAAPIERITGGSIRFRRRDGRTVDLATAIDPPRNHHPWHPWRRDRHDIRSVDVAASQVHTIGEQLRK